MRFFSRASVVGADHAVSRFVARRSSARQVDSGDRWRGRIVGGDPALHLRDARERSVPALLEFAGDQAVGGISGVILSEGAIGDIACRLEITSESFTNLIALLRGLLRRRRGCSGGARPDHAKERLFDRVIDAQAAKGDAAWFAGVHPAAAAAVPRNLICHAAVAQRQLAPTAVAADQAGEQRP
jgi:hypothetical protein